MTDQAKNKDQMDWRLTGQEKYLQGRTLRWKKWWPYREGWDHDHCAFCWKDICDQEEPGSEIRGWVTEDDYHWICAGCFEDFKERFDWDLQGTDAVGSPGEKKT